MSQHTAELAQLARQHLQAANAALPCADEGKVAHRWVRIASLAAATAAVDACLETHPEGWQNRRGVERSSGQRNNLAKVVLRKPHLRDSWGRLKLAYNDRYQAGRECTEAEARRALTDATSIIKELVGIGS